MKRSSVAKMEKKIYQAFERTSQYEKQRPNVNSKSWRSSYYSK